MKAESRNNRDSGVLGALITWLLERLAQSRLRTLVAHVYGLEDLTGSTAVFIDPEWPLLADSWLP